MVIVHVQLPSPFIDGWGYQENGLAYVESRQGHDVYVLAPNYILSPDNSVQAVEEGVHKSVEGATVFRIKPKHFHVLPFLNKYLNRYPIYDLLVKTKPDLIMVHGLAQGLYINDVLRYKKQFPQCALVSDTHRTPENSTSNRIKALFSKIFYTFLNRRFLKKCERVFGIAPQCIQHAISTRGVSEKAIELLPLGFNPYLIDWENRYRIKASFREKNSIDGDCFVFAHGGKIIPRRKTEEVIKAFNRLEDPKLRLVIFGDICHEMKESLMKMINESSRVIYLGHLSQKDYLDVFLGSDVACFPGGQSSLWQEAIGCGLPLIVDKKENVDYLNEGGNVIFCNSSDELDILSAMEIVLDKDSFSRAKKAAELRRDYFSYERISNRILEISNLKK